jgi:hypothetical protein
MASWKLLIGNLAAHLPTLPHARPLVGELEAVVTEIQEIDKEQEIARGRLRELTHRRQEAERRGDKLWRRLGALLKGNFGFTSQELIQFGFKPRPPQTGPRKKRARPASASGEAAPVS